jgi:toxin-antitoxin system PIN domain toxin
VRLLDANILLYAYDSDSAHHAACRSWLEAAFNSEEIVALPWQTLVAFVRISTNPRAIKKPLQIADACSIVSSWLDQVNVSVIGAGERFWELLKDQMFEAEVTGPLVTDAALAALALEHGATLCSIDRDFRRFRGLKLIDPTAQNTLGLCDDAALRSW